jgi:hypothetical protein
MSVLTSVSNVVRKNTLTDAECREAYDEVRMLCDQHPGIRWHKLAVDFRTIQHGKGHIQDTQEHGNTLLTKHS